MTREIMAVGCTVPLIFLRYKVEVKNQMSGEHKGGCIGRKQMRGEKGMEKKRRMNRQEREG